jgi:glucose-1-phosphate adenylyltransferase
MVTAHVDSGAGCTVRPIRQPIELADQFGVIDIDPAQPDRIRAFLEKPKDPEGLPDSPEEVLASMGNYVFDADALRESVTSDSTLEGSKHDMGGDIVPAFVSQGLAGVYDYKDNDVPGSNDRDRGYWRDVGTMGSYYRRAHGPGRAAAGVQPVQRPVADLHVVRTPAAGEDRRGATSASRSRSSTRSCRPAWW